MATKSLEKDRKFQGQITQSDSCQYYLTDGIFETGSYGVLSKLQNPTIGTTLPHHKQIHLLKQVWTYYF